MHNETKQGQFTAGLFFHRCSLNSRVFLDSRIITGANYARKLSKSGNFSKILKEISQ